MKYGLYDVDGAMKTMRMYDRMLAMTQIQKHETIHYISSIFILLILLGHFQIHRGII
jgi:hypothetical protein